MASFYRIPAIRTRIYHKIHFEPLTILDGEYQIYDITIMLLIMSTMKGVQIMKPWVVLVRGWAVEQYKTEEEAKAMATRLRQAITEEVRVVYMT